MLSHMKFQINKTFVTQRLSIVSNEFSAVLFTRVLDNNLQNICKNLWQSVEKCCREGEKEKNKKSVAIKVFTLSMKSPPCRV